MYNLHSTSHECCVLIVVVSVLGARLKHVAD